MPPLQQHAIFTVKIGKPKIQKPNAAESNAPLEVMNAIAEIVVDSSLHLPDMFTLRINDPQQRWIDDEALFALGNEVMIEAQAQQQHGGSQAPLFQGEITALEPNFDAQGMTAFVVRGYAKTNRLHLGRHSRTFTNQSDRDIIETLAKEVGLTAEVDKTDISYDYVLQKNQTNMEFLIARAERIGYQVYTMEDKLCFKKGESRRDDATVTLDLGKELRTFRPCISTAHQATKVRVRGWDAKTKNTIQGEAQPSPKLQKPKGLNQPSGEQVQAAFKMTAPAIIVDAPVASTEEANALAQGLANDLDRDFIQAEGTCFGNPQIKAGAYINLTGLGERFSGDYFVTAASHLYDASGYTVTFTVSGREPHTLHHLLTKHDLQQSPMNGRVSSVVIGLVTNLNDPAGIGRVKVKFPWLADDAGSEIESTWAKVAAPMAGPTRGFFFLPEVDDEVLVAFEHGDVNRPYIVGALWNKRDQPPVAQTEAVQGGKVVQRVIRSRAGHEIILDDTDGKQSITVHSQGGHIIQLNDAPTSVITVSDPSGQNKVTIDATQQMVSVQSGGNLEVRAVGNLTLQAGGMLTLAGQAGLSLSSPAGGNLEATGPLSIKSTSAISIDGGAIAELRGILVKIN
ncbi:MAG: VgrG-related protein [Caldilineaceae bacterium]